METALTVCIPDIFIVLLACLMEKLDLAFEVLEKMKSLRKRSVNAACT